MIKCHKIEKQDIFVDKFPDIIQWLLDAIFIVSSLLPKSSLIITSPRSPSPPVPPSPITPRIGSTTTITYTSSHTAVTNPPLGTIGTGLRTGSAG